MKILITRPLEQSLELAHKLGALGHESVVAPLLEIEHKNLFLDLKKFDALIVTSRNALFAINDLNKKVFIVGQATTDLARSLGLYNSVNIGKDIAELRRNLPFYKYNNLLYLSGRDVADNLDDIGNIKRAIVYIAKKVKEVPPSFLEFMTLPSSDKLALFFSIRSAQIFLDLIHKYSLYSYCEDIAILALSEKIADLLLKEIKFKDSYVSKEPTVDHLITRISDGQ
jgi:uroporphyrinogen-III synthase